jgi:hypothetical protein
LRGSPETVYRWRAAGGFALLVLSLFSDAILRGQVFYERDLHVLWYPRIESMVRAVAQGAWPLWDPHSSFGLPALADPSYQMAYPLTWLNLVLLPATYYKVFVAVHCAGAGLGLCLLVRQWGVSRPGAFVAGALWASSGPFLSFLTLFHHFAGMAWMPWVLLATHVALVRGTVAASLAVGGALAGQVLAGSGDMCLMTGVLALGYAATVRAGLDDARHVPLSRVLVGVCLAGASALVLSAAQWLPTAAILAEGSRLRLGPEVNTYWSVHPLSLLDVVVPRLVSFFPMSPPLREMVFEGREPLLTCLYLGPPVLVLAVLGAMMRGPRLRLFALGAALLFLLASLGRHTPLYSLLLAVPPVRMLRYPVKYMAAASLAVALLGGLGLDAWRGPWSPGQRRRAAVVAGMALVMALAAFAAGSWLRADPLPVKRYTLEGGALEPAAARLWWAGLKALSVGVLVLLRVRTAEAGGWSTAAMGTLAFLDVLSSGRGVNHMAPAELLRYRPAVVQHLDAASRVYVPPAPQAWLYEQYRALGDGRNLKWAVGIQEALTPPSGARWGIQGSFEGDLTGLAPPVLAAWTVALEQARPQTALAIVRLANVGGVVHVQPETFAGLPTAIQLPSVFSAPIRLTHVPDPLPRTYMAGGARPAGDHEAFALLVGPDFDVRHEVVVEEGRVAVARPLGFRGSSRIAWSRADAVALEVEASHPGFAVLVDGYQAGWRAWVDGRPAEVLRANTLFRAVPVPAGRHLVVMRYRPAAALWGGLLSAVGLAAAAALSARRLVSRPGEAAPALPRGGSMGPTP